MGAENAASIRDLRRSVPDISEQLRQGLRDALPANVTEDQIDDLTALARRYGDRLRDLRVHHEGVWSLRDNGECGCECPKCFRGDECVCADCTYDHDHSRRAAK